MSILSDYHPEILDELNGTACACPPDVASFDQICALPAVSLSNRRSVTDVRQGQTGHGFAPDSPPWPPRPARCGDFFHARTGQEAVQDCAGRTRMDRGDK
jgi:hypothetical protein